MAEDTLDFYALLSPEDLATPVGVFRVRRGDGGLFVEQWNGTAWAPGPYSLMRYVVDGELGADQITPEQADRLTALLPA